MNHNFIYKSIITALLAVLFIGCDIIESPYKKDTQGNNGNQKEDIQRVLLEDFTGHTCVNCPDAHKIAKNIQELYPGQVIVLAIHVGESFAAPTKDHPYDFRTNAGNTIGDFFKATNAALPVGMINRSEKGTTRLIQRFDWETETAKFISLKADMSIKINPEYNPNTKEITVNTDIEYFNDGSRNHHLILLISEDSIISYQKGKPDKEDYVHNHVLRSSITNPWGDRISSSDIKRGDKFNKQHKFKIPDEHSTSGLMYYWRPEKINIVAIIHDFENTYKVMQVAEKKLLP